jgi:release factor glutamine methyltransferase
MEVRVERVLVGSLVAPFERNPMQVSQSSVSRDGIVSRLRSAGCVFAEEEADLLLAEGEHPKVLAARVEQRAAGMPLEQVLGWAEFCGFRVDVAPGVFVPRRRTEFLVQRATDLAPGRTDVIVDLCCGSGAVAAALGKLLAPAELHAADVDPAAVGCARKNLPGAEVHEGDLFDALPTGLRGRVDILTANVPYVPTREIALLPAEARLHEAACALDGGADGLAVMRRVAAGAPEWLAPNGSVLVEMSERQAGTASGIFESCGLAAQVAYSAEHGSAVVSATRRSSRNALKASGTR